MLWQRRRRTRTNDDPKALCFSSKRNKRLLHFLYQKCLQKLFSVFVNEIQRRYRLINY